MAAMPGTSKTGLSELVDRLRGDRSLDDIAYAARSYTDRKLTGSELSKILHGQRPYSVDILAAIARALEVDPSELPEYRLAQARRQLDEREVGLTQALRTLAALSADGIILAPGGELAPLSDRPPADPVEQARREARALVEAAEPENQRPPRETPAAKPIRRRTPRAGSAG